MKIYVFVIVGILCVAGCTDTLRFPPSQLQKQSAELTHQLAVKVNSEGTQATSPASQRLVEGTKAELAYIGRPIEPPDVSKFDTITMAANSDAAKRPDTWQMANNLFELGLGLAGLLGGVYGTRAVKFIQDARAKTKALQEVIQGNELFKEKASPEAVETFKTSQSDAQSNSTAKIVAQLKI